MFTNSQLAIQFILLTNSYGLLNNVYPLAKLLMCLVQKQNSYIANFKLT